MEKLSSYGYLNDERFLSSMLSSLLGQNVGASKIKQRLVAKGFDGDHIQAAMSQLKDDGENDFFSKALAFKNRKFGEAPILDRALAQKALRALVSKGFSFADSQKAIRHVSNEN
jgi:regulatory protein